MYYSKFTKPKGSKIKEEAKQLRKKANKERKAFFEAKRQEARAEAAEERKLKFEKNKKRNEKNDDFHIKKNSKEKSLNNFKNKASDKKEANPKKSKYLENLNKQTPKQTNISFANTNANIEMPLNKYLAHCGICSRREAVDIIKSGLVKLNGKTVLSPATKVNANDKVVYKGKPISPVKNLVYILLNKPKDFITTTEDPQERKTVLHLIKNATNERVYPVGRLDRNTTGVLLLTNDGDLTQKLSHPQYEIRKVYEVTLNKDLTKKDFEKILAGLNLDDGFIKPDAIAYAHAKDKTVIGIEIHSGRNRIVRRIFESLGYDVKKLDRVLYGILTKKNLERGKWRYLNEKEVRLLKSATPKKRK